MHSKNIQTAGKSLQEANSALIMLHGRGGSAGDMLGLAPYLEVADYALLAPQATNNTWYPNSFLANPQENEPWLTSALNVLEELVHDVKEQGIDQKNIYLLGFSQGACLTLEFAARHATRYGGLVALTGGLIGDQVQADKYSGDFKGTPALVTTGNPDPHVPVERVNASVGILEELHAKVHMQVYEGRPHTVTQDEFHRANQLVFTTSP
jgi:phospholipase/carboxylesterase